AEARLAAKRAARAEARDIRMRELERQQKESHAYSESHNTKKKTTYSRKDLLSGLYHDQRNYSSLRYSKPIPSYHTRKMFLSLFFSLFFILQSSSLYSDPVATTRSYRVSPSVNTGLIRSISLASLSGDGLHNSYSSYTLEEKSEKSHSEIFSRPSSRNSIPLSGNSSRRGSGDTSSLLDPDASLSELRDIYDLKDQIHDVEGRYMQGLKELKDSLAEVEEKYKKAMVSNAQLDNEKNNLVYQVDTLKDVIEEKEEQIAEYHREYEEKSKENQRMQLNIDCITKEVFDLQETINWKDKKIGALERQKNYFDCIKKERDELREELADLKETMKRGEKHGLVIIPDGTPNGDINHDSAVGAITVVSQEAAQVLESAGEGPLGDANRQISEYKFRLSKAEQDITTLEQNIGRLEGQVARYKNAAENAEKVEDELKAEKRKLLRELRAALDKIEEMEMTNSHLMKRLEKMKANRSALLSQQ
ncbi:hypothetical protein ASZ78_008225, partial [Callipepla squamata]